MTTGHIFIATSIDGFIARENDDLDWLELPGSDAEDHGYDAFIAQMDGIVMGRGTYEKVKTFGAWPYKVPVLVLSRTLAGTETPPADNVTFHDTSPDEAMQICKDMGWKKAYIDGGQIIQSFLKADLVEDMIVSRIPVLLGAGKALFGALDGGIKLQHLVTQSFPSGLTQSRYRIAR